MLLSLKAGGTGLTLTAANHVVHLDRWWNPAVENQATDRAFRIGQRRNVQVRKFVCPGTVEERIDEMITKKRALSELVVGDGEGWLTELSTDTLRELFTLGVDAVDDGGMDRRCLTRTGGATPSRPGRGRSAAASRSTAPAARWPAPGGRSGSSGCWSRSGSAGRLSRGRSYARAGQIVSLDVEAGGAVGQWCRARRPKPYQVRIGIPAFGKAEWAQLGQALVDDASYAAALLNGEMPREIESVFAAVGLTLFPASARDLAMDCTCPDHQVPCKHLAAVFYVLAERFDADPFEILALRGRDREALLDDLRARRAAAAASPAAGARRARPRPRCWTASSCAGARPRRAAGRPAHPARRAARPDPGAPGGGARRARSPTCCAPPTAHSAEHEGAWVN